MVSTKLFQSAPPFPDDVPLAQLATISLAGLSAKHQSESETMYKVCQQSGFFLLGLKGDPVGEAMIAELEKIFGVIKATMEVPEEDQAKFQANPPKDLAGYKPEGFMKTETGQQDRCKFFVAYQDHLLGNRPTIDMPEPANAARDLLKSYIEHGQHVLSQILAGLEHQLDLRPGQLRNLQPPDIQSGTILRMIRYSSSPKEEDMRTGLLPHTDFGSITLLANVVGGLQVLKPKSHETEPDEWLWVKPQPGCLIVNMGDAMVEWTGGVLRSSLHRVFHAPGEQRFVERFALAMLVRARFDAKMERIVGGRIPQREDDEREGISGGGVGIAGLTAAEWEEKKAMMLSAGEDIARSRGGRAARASPVGGSAE